MGSVPKIFLVRVQTPVRLDEMKKSGSIRWGWAFAALTASCLCAQNALAFGDPTGGWNTTEGVPQAWSEYAGSAPYMTQLPENEPLEMAAQLGIRYRPSPSAVKFLTGDNDDEDWFSGTPSASTWLAVMPDSTRTYVVPTTTCLVTQAAEYRFFFSDVDHFSVTRMDRYDFDPGSCFNLVTQLNSSIAAGTLPAFWLSLTDASNGPPAAIDLTRSLPPQRITTYVSRLGTRYTTTIPSQFVEMAACPPRTTPLFNEPFMQLADIETLLPLGNYAPPGHILPTNHIYATPPHDSLGRPINKPLYSPGALRVTRVTQVAFLDSSGTPIDVDYDLDFRVCREVRGYFLHVADLRGPLTPYASLLESTGRCSSHVEGGRTRRLCSLEVAIEAAPGTEIGSAGRHSSPVFGNVHTVDLNLQDTRYPMALVNPSLYPPIWRNTVCPIDYFNSSLQSAYNQKFGRPSLTFPGIIWRTTAPYCGTAMQDVANTAQGSWFNPLSPPSSNGPSNEQNQLGLYHDVIEPSVPIFVLGAAFPEVASSAYGFAINNFDIISGVNLDFHRVNADDPSKVYCVENLFHMPPAPTPSPNFVILMRMPAVRTLEIEIVNGRRTCDFPRVMTSARKTFFR